MLRPDEVPTLKLPVLSMKVSSVPPCRAIIRHEAPARKRSVVTVQYKEASVNTELTGADLELLENQLRETEEKLQVIFVDSWSKKVKAYHQVQTLCKTAQCCQHDEYC